MSDDRVNVATGNVSSHVPVNPYVSISPPWIREGPSASIAQSVLGAAIVQPGHQNISPPTETAQLPQSEQVSDDTGATADNFGKEGQEISAAQALAMVRDAARGGASTFSSTEVLRVLEGSLREDEAHLQRCRARLHGLQLHSHSDPHVWETILLEARQDIAKAEATRQARIDHIISFLPKY